MSIKILPESEIKQVAHSFQQPAILFSNPKNLYQRRAARLRELAVDHPFADYLHFAADIVESQAKVLENTPVESNETLVHLKGILPLEAKNFPRERVWLNLLKSLLKEVKPKTQEPISSTIEWLEKASDSELEQLADYLLKQEFNLVSSDKAVFIWAALSLYWLQLVQHIPHSSQAESTDNLYLCPVCGAMPVASIVHFGDTQGLRYLHCSLCESEWNLVRAQCTNCNQSGKLDYWSFNEELALIRAESCGDCESYLKIMFQDKDPQVEAVADDLASLFLDMEMEEKGFSRSGINPFLFPASEH
ncbi:formate dehydrogenase accessory protein FdhE [Rodentibacter caecimuris]|uniref:Protein FdhE homolog n=1 Tax=Rodentibacter caecimuris TaxID=1796644 RepID=A0ABX3KWI0_9PAST|nr:formate dehydrogenase accessory protein FdhE [Rodentibacter heylii]